MDLVGRSLKGRVNSESSEKFWVEEPERREKRRKAKQRLPGASVPLSSF
jgi:hypothetical protein